MLNAIKNSLLDSQVYLEPVSHKPLDEPPNSLDDEFEDIEVKPVVSKPISRPVTTKKPTTTTKKPTTTTKKPTTTTTKPTTSIVMDEVETYKVVCYYTNWAWYRYVNKLISRD